MAKKNFTNNRAIWNGKCMLRGFQDEMKKKTIDRNNEKELGDIIH